MNVDSQASFDNILVSVIGEISNKSEPPRKFVQTFVLAEQPNGYYVLNDIFRYLADEDEEVIDEPSAQQPATQDNVPAAAEKAAPKEPTAELQADTETAAQEVDEKLEESAVNGVSKDTVEEKTPEVEQAKEQESLAPAATAAPVPVVPASSDALQPEKPKSPIPSPAAPSPKKPAPPVAEKENIPVKPPSMTWASIAGARTAASAPTPATPQAPQSKPAPKEAPRVTGGTENATSQASSSNGSEWQTAGADHGKRQARPQSVSGPSEDNTLAFIKNVNDKVEPNQLKQMLSRFGKLKYFDVSKQRVSISIHEHFSY